MRNLSEVNINTTGWRGNGPAAGRLPRKPESAEANVARKCPTATYISPPRHPSAGLAAASNATSSAQRNSGASGNEAQCERLAYEEQMRQSQSTQQLEAEASKANVYNSTTTTTTNATNTVCGECHTWRGSNAMQQQQQGTGWAEEPCSCPRCVRARAESEYYATYSCDETAMATAMPPHQTAQEEREDEGEGIAVNTMVSRDERKMAMRAARCGQALQQQNNNNMNMNAGCMWASGYKPMPYASHTNNASGTLYGGNNSSNNSNNNMYGPCACPHCSSMAGAAMPMAGANGMYGPTCCYPSMAAAMGAGGGATYYSAMNAAAATCSAAGGVNGMPMWMPGAAGVMPYMPGSAAPRTRQTLLKSLGEVPVMSVKARTRSNTTTTTTTTTTANSTRPPSSRAMAQSTTDESLPEDVITTDTLTATATASCDSTGDEAEYNYGMGGRRVVSLGSARSREQEERMMPEPRPYISRTMTHTPATSVSSLTSLSMANSYGALPQPMPRTQPGHTLGLQHGRQSIDSLSGLAPSTKSVAATSNNTNMNMMMKTRPMSASASSASAAMAAVSPTELLCVELMQGRIVELACTATGKAQLQAVLHSHPALVLDLCVREMSLGMDRVALDSQGCHVLRAVVELCDAAQTQQIVATLHEELIIGMCTVSQYTRRVIQSLFERALVDLSFVIDVIARNGFYLAATQQGCIAFMRVYERCNREQQAVLMEPLTGHLAELALDPLGNYVVQCAMEQSERTVAAQLAVGCFTGRLLAMSCDKFASNVMEKVARCCGDVPAVRRLLMDELVYNPVSLQEVINDGYGNFVLQALIECVSQPMEFKRMCDRLKPVLPNSPFAAKIETKLKQRQRVIGATEQVSFARRRNSAGHPQNKSGKGQSSRGNQQQQRNNTRSSMSSASCSQ